MKSLQLFMVMLFCLLVSCKFHYTQLSKYPNGQTKEKYSILKGNNGIVVRDGKYVLFYENGKIREQGKFLNGKLFSTRTCFYENGQKMLEESYNTKGISDGFQTEWFDNGKIQSQTSVKAGVAEGQHKEWYSDGRIKMDIPLSNNVWNGHVLFFTENGDTAIDLLCSNGKISKINKLIPAFECVLLDYASKNMVEYSISSILNVSFARNYINQVSLFSNFHNISDSMARSGISVFYSNTLPQKFVDWFKRYEREIFYNGSCNGSVVSACRNVLPVLFFISYDNETQRIHICYFINWDKSKNNRDFLRAKENPNILAPMFFSAIQIGVRFAAPYFQRAISAVKQFNGYYLTSITDFECIYRKPNDDYVSVVMGFNMKPKAFTVSVAPYQPQTFYCSYNCLIGAPYTPDGQLSNNALPYIFCGAMQPK
jgi:antitoxin component YwqK of YwqJK toxin-antitoxin module